MPVSSPSYFPPQRGNFSIIGITAGLNALGSRDFLAGQSAGQNTAVAVGDLIVIGYNSFSAGTVASPITDAGLAGTLIIGNNTALALVDNSGGLESPSIFIGGNTAPVLTNIDACTIIGHNAITRYQGVAGQFQGTLRQNVVIGNETLNSVNPSLGVSSGVVENVIIGYRAFAGSGISKSGSVTQSVIIGARACEDAGISNINEWPQANVVIGYRAGNAMDDPLSINSVIIGQTTCSGQRQVRSCVVVGGNSSTGGNAFGVTFPDANVVCGASSFVGGVRSIILGGESIFNGSGCILIGFRGSTNVPAGDSRCVIGTDGGRVLYTDNMSVGNVLLGNSVAGGAVLNFGTGTPTNVVKLMNGTAATSNPVGGGYFYVNAGALHWVGSAGTDTIVAPA